VTYTQIFLILLTHLLTYLHCYLLYLLTYFSYLLTYLLINLHLLTYFPPPVLCQMGCFTILSFYLAYLFIILHANCDMHAYFFVFLQIMQKSSELHEIFLLLLIHFLTYLHIYLLAHFLTHLHTYTLTHSLTYFWPLILCWVGCYTILNSIIYFARKSSDFHANLSPFGPKK